MASSSNNANENALAFAAVSLFANESRGAKPLWHELSAWREGSLNPDRSDEILSHVANDPDCFQQWLDIVEAEHWVETQASSTSPAHVQQDLPPVEDSFHTRSRPGSVSKHFTAGLDWLRSYFQQPLAVYGGAFAIIMLAVLIVPLMREGDIASLQQQIDRSLDTYIASEAGLPGSAPASRSTRNLGGLFDDLSPADVTRQHFQYGMRQAAQRLMDGSSSNWQQWSSAQSDAPASCGSAIDKANCVASEQDLIALGQWALLNYAACQQSSVFNDKAYWAQQHTLYKQFSSTDILSSNPLVGKILTPLATPSSDALCTIADQLIAAGS